MAWFTVQYRGPDGKNESVQIEAADRAGVFAELKKRGISAVRVEESKGKVKPAKPRQAKPAEIKDSSMRGVLAGLIAIFLVGVSVWLAMRKSPEQEQEQVETVGQKKSVEAVPLAKQREEKSVEAPQKI